MAVLTTECTDTVATEEDTAVDTAGMADMEDMEATVATEVMLADTAADMVDMAAVTVDMEDTAAEKDTRDMERVDITTKLCMCHTPLSFPSINIIIRTTMVYSAAETIGGFVS